MVRVFDAASNPSTMMVVIHRADLAGAWTDLNSGKPDSEARSGNPTCIEGEDTDF